MTKANLFLFAAPRSGSTQMAHWLNSHPDICLSPVKEPNHFSAHEFDSEYVRTNHLNDVDPANYLKSNRRYPAQFSVFRDPDHYVALFADMKTSWRLDASTSYLSCPSAAAAVHSYAPNARIIVLMRDPVSRACSHYRLAIRTGRTTVDLPTQLAAELSGSLPLAAQYLLRPSHQNQGLERITSVFPAEQIRIVQFERMIGDPKAILSDLALWLSLDPDLFDLSKSSRNAGCSPRFMAMNRALES